MGMTILQAMLELNRLDQAIVEKRNEFLVLNVYHETVVNELENYELDVNEQAAAAWEAWKNLGELTANRMNLARKINLANARVGLDALLSARNDAKRALTNFSGLTQYSKGVNKAQHTPYTNGNSNKSYWSHTFQFNFVTEKTIKEMITDLKNTLTSLEVQIQTKNCEPLE